MKKLISAALCLSLAAFAASVLLPLVFFKSPAEKIPEVSGENAASPTPASVIAETDAETNVRALIGGQVQTLSMHDYLCGVLAAEMPASFETEALRAQAVAARTYTLYKMLVEPSGNHPEADVCDDITCCKAYAPEAEMREKWGDNYEKYAARMAMAVSSTDGVCVAYSGKPALAVFHAFSSGRTENSEDVWSGSVPYLRSVESPETEADVPDYSETVKVSLADFCDTVKSSYPDAVFTGGAPFSDDADFTDGGRLSSVTVGGVKISGTALRSLFSLRSSDIEMSYSDGEVTLRTSGSGHGVGMSQYGANVYAQKGYDYAEILLHYYDGAEIASVSDIISR